MRRALALLALAACGSPPTTLEIVSASPASASMAGGSITRLTGSGFLDGDAGGNRVLIASREAPLARAIDDSTLEVVVPPAEQSGDAEVVVLNDHGNARATGIFRYSTPPAIESVEPANVVFTSTETVVTMTGSGFLDGGAGMINVVVDGVLVTDATVTSDTTLSFVAPPGLAFVRPDIEVINDRGSVTKSRAFRYAPSVRDGLLLFTNTGNELAVFYDPTDHSTVSIPIIGGFTQFRSVVRDDRGDYWASDRSTQRFGQIDMRTHRLVAPSAQIVRMPAMTRVGARYLGINRNPPRFGELDPATGVFTQIGSLNLVNGSYGIAFDGTTLYITTRFGSLTAIAPIDPVAGTLGTPIPISPDGFHVSDMRFFKGVLYVASFDSLYTLDPHTGVTTPVPISIGHATAIEPFEP